MSEELVSQEENIRRQCPIFRAFVRPILVMGGEREPMLLIGLVCFALVFVAMTKMGIIMALFMWFSLMGIFRLIAKKDPYMCKVYSRQLRYRRKGVFHPRATPYCESGYKGGAREK